MLSQCQVTNAQTVLPSDAAPSCTVPSTNFASWFTSGTVTLNGAVQPADSLAFVTTNDCNFFVWGENMFLWLTSPAPVTYGGGGGLVMNTPIFYDVSTPDQNGNRTFIPISSRGIRNFMVRKAQVGPRGLPVMMNREGRMIEVKPAPPKPAILDRAGNPVTVASTRFSFFGTPHFLDEAGKEIKPLLGPNGRPVFLNGQGRRVEMRRVVRGQFGGVIFFDGAGNPIEFGEGEAQGNDVLMDQHGSLVYYAIQVNDVYAYFLTGQVGGQIMTSAFPSNQLNMTSISNFAQAHGTTFSTNEINTMTMEIKSAWVETNGLDVSQYITMNATIPVYNKSSTTNWTTNGSKLTTLALVGIHVVGTLLGHPEMVWATFEHMDNSPQTAYSYFTTGNTTKTNAADTGPSTTQNWLFCATGSSGPYNKPHMTAAANDTIAAIPPFNISPSDTERLDAWGSLPGSFTPTELISINNSVRGQLIPGDVRANYILTGATWTGGAPPIGSIIYGSTTMANTTLETYQQPSNCFGCHDGLPMLGTMSSGQGTGLSHIYGALKPLTLP